ncbi:MAG: hypothetical protein RDV41_07370 [Planctomycetota bacterium]|nr:hypothetical protein [Planctomycetota bacterium]
MRKKKGAAEFFELFKTRVKDAGVNVGSQTAPTRDAAGATIPPAVQPQLEEQHRPAAWLGPDNGKRLAESSLAPTPSGLRASVADDGDERLTPGERTFTLTVNTAALIVLLLISAAFASFGFGFWFGKEAGRNEALEGNAKASLKGDEASIETAGARTVLPPDRYPNVSPDSAKGGDSTGVKKPSEVQRNPGPGVSKPVDPPPVKPTPPSRFYSIRLVDWELDDPDGKACAKNHVEDLRKAGFEEGSVRTVTRGSKRVLAVCYGQYETETEALKYLSRLQKIQRAYSSANVMLISESR